MARWVYGVGPVRELLRVGGQVQRLCVDASRVDRAREGDPLVELVTLAKAAGIPAEPKARQELDRIVGADARHQGVVAEAVPRTYCDLDAMLAAATDAGEVPFLVALDGIEDPRNLGAILRSAYLLGAHGVLLPNRRASGVTPVVTKASAGASELIPIAQVGNLVRSLAELKEHGLWNVAIHAVPEAQPLSSLDLRLPVCLVLGSEGSGVRSLVARGCDFHGRIPMHNRGVGSFNVSAAATIAFYETVRQRSAPTGITPPSPT